jgi:hypothetical protein
MALSGKQIVRKDGRNYNWQYPIGKTQSITPIYLTIAHNPWANPLYIKELNGSVFVKHCVRVRHGPGPISIMVCLGVK